MFSVGDRIIHPGQGLCQIIEIRDDPMPVYVLEAHCGRGTARLLCPVSMGDRLHLPIDRASALDAIEGYEALELDGYRNRNVSLEEGHFKDLLKRGIPDSLAVVKSMCARIQAAERRGQKPNAYLLRVLKDAWARSLSELAYALEVEEVAALLERHGAHVSHLV